MNTAITYKSEGIKQSADGKLYMVLAASDGSTKIVNLDAELPPSFHDVNFTKNERVKHSWNFSKEAKQFVASSCGVFGCCCCDSINTAARMEKLRAASIQY